jgi:endonuclease YncB( thermonuclease family)
LQLIDCPESKQPFRTRAKQFTGDLAFGKEVQVHVRDIDRYHSTVAEIILPDGRDLKNGFAPNPPGAGGAQEDFRRFFTSLL